MGRRGTSASRRADHELAQQRALPAFGEVEPFEQVFAGPQPAAPVKPAGESKPAERASGNSENEVVVTPIDAEHCRLHVRTHAGDAPLPIAPIMLLTFEPAHLVMERAMLEVSECV